MTKEEDSRRHYTEPVRSIDRADCEALIRLAIQEDAPDGDLCSNAIFSDSDRSEATFITREKGVLCGMSVISVLLEIDHEINDSQISLDGIRADATHFNPGDKLAELSGRTRDILRLERIMLNILQYLSGVATQTKTIVDQVGPQIAILDTRKTIPAYRRLVKYAVYCGGGTNHRIHLSDMAMIKDNHIAAAGGLTHAINSLRLAYPELPLNVEVDTLAQLSELLELNQKVDVVLLDNMNRSQIDQACEMIQQSGKSILIELSGGWTPARLSELQGLSNVGVSMGFLTHTTRFLDLSLEIESAS